MVNYLVTGGNRGIGFALVKELAKESNSRVFATARDPSKAKDLTEFSKNNSNVEIVKLSDVSSSEATKSAAKIVESKLEKDEGIDILIGNAGIMNSSEKAIDTDPEVVIDHFKINALGNFITIQQFLPLLKKSKTRQVFVTSSVAGSITGFIKASVVPYGSSKAALNFIIRVLNSELSDEGFKFVAFHPGLVTSDMGYDAIEKLLGGDIESAEKSFGVITPEISAKNIVKNVIKGLSEGKIDTDHMWTFNGDKYDW